MRLALSRAVLRALPLLAALVLADAVVPDWDRIAPPATPTRLAWHAGALFLGTESGLYRRGEAAPGGWALVLPSEPILDLASAGSELLAATPAGLWAWSAESGRAARVPLGAGEAVTRVSVDAGGTAWVASAGGVFRRAPGEREFAREPSLPPGAVSALACAGAETFVGFEGAIYAGDSARGFTRVLAGLDDGWWELLGATSAGGITLLGVANGVWRLDASGARQLELGVGQLQALARSGERVFVASERGLYEVPLARAGDGAWQQRLSVPVLGLALAGDRLWIATDRGLAAFAADDGAPVPPPPVVRGPDPAERARQARMIAALQQAVLAYQELAPRRLTVVEERARWAGLYPQLRAGGSWQRDDEKNGGSNTTFTSGALHNLWDQDRSHQDGWDAAVTLTWELEDLALPDNALAVSRERRLVVSLRDQVLERVNHLYFQRVRLLGELAALPGDAAAKRAELELAAAELAAQLDAWSGGAFSRLESDSPLTKREP